VDGDMFEWGFISIKEASKMSINRSISGNIEPTYSANGLVSSCSDQSGVYAGLQASLTSKGIEFLK
jgi:hypothetical protein